MNHLIRRMITSKVFKSSAEAIADIKSGNSLICGGFSLCGLPENLLRTLAVRDIRDLVVYSGLASITDEGLGWLLKKKMIAVMHTSYIGSSADAEKQYFNGELELHLTPLGSLVEKIKAGSNGILGFYTRTGEGTVVEDGGFPLKYSRGGKIVEKYSMPKAVKHHNGKNYLYEEAITADFAFVKAWKADTYGNLVFRKSARNLNADIPGAARVTIAEVEEIVQPGELDPDQIHVPGILVQRIVKGERYDKKIEKLTEIDETGHSVKAIDKVREVVAKRAARELKEGNVVNLGIGIPTLVPSYLPENSGITIQSEIGILGIGPYPKKGEADPDLTNAGKETVTLLKGSSLFSMSQSFGYMRGGHLDISLLGALQVSSHGDLASWIIPGKMIKGMGGAMDLVSNKTKCIVCMEHTTPKGQPKIVEECSLPFTGKKCISMIITELGVFEFRSNTGITLTEIAEGVTLDEIIQKTACKFHVEHGLKTMLQ